MPPRRPMIGTTSRKLWPQPGREATTSGKLCRSASVQGRRRGRQNAALDPVRPAHRPVGETVHRIEVETGVAHLDDVARAEVVVEPDRVLGVDVEAAVRGVAVALLTHAPRGGVDVLPRV